MKLHNAPFALGPNYKAVSVSQQSAIKTLVPFIGTIPHPQNKLTQRRDPTWLQIDWIGFCIKAKKKN